MGMTYDAETLALLQRTVELLLEEPDTDFLTSAGEETTTHAYAAFLQSIIDGQAPASHPTA